jgi:hypothetical protein
MMIGMGTPNNHSRIPRPILSSLASLDACIRRYEHILCIWVPRVIKLPIIARWNKAGPGSSAKAGGGIYRVIQQPQMGFASSSRLASISAKRASVFMIASSIASIPLHQLSDPGGSGSARVCPAAPPAFHFTLREERYSNTR